MAGQEIKVCGTVAPVGEREIIVDADEVDGGRSPQRIEMEENIARAIGRLVAEIFAPVGGVGDLRFGQDRFDLGGETNDQWLLALMRNNDEPREVRTAALSRVASRNMPIGDAVKLYATVADRQMREQLINVYGQRREPEATDKLLDIVKQ